MLLFFLAINIFIPDKNTLDKKLKEYLESGYLDAQPFIKNDSLFIETGNLYYIGVTNVISPLKFNDTIFLGNFYLKPFSKRNIEIIIDTVLYYYADIGFPFCEISPEFSNYDSIINIDLRVNLNNLCRIKDIRIYGRLRNKLLLKKIENLVDSTFSRRKLMDLIKEIDASLIAKVDSFKIVEEDEDVVVVLFLKEISYGDISGIIGFQYNSKLSINFIGDFYNPFGFGSKWRIKFQKIMEEKAFSIKFSIPFSTKGNDFSISYHLLTSLDTLVSNAFLLKHIYTFNDFRIGNGVKYIEERGFERKRDVFYNLLFGIRRNLSDLYFDFRGKYIYLLKTSLNLKRIGFDTKICFTSEGMMDEMNFFPIIRGYPSVYNNKVISSSLTYTVYKKDGFNAFVFFDSNIYPYINKKSFGIGFSRERFNFEIAYPFEYGIKNIMLIFNLSPVDFFENP